MPFVRTCPALLAALLVALAVTKPIGADTSPMRTGLIRNSTGLPAVFPLQVKTAPGRDHHLALREAGTGETVLTAYIAGGSFFKVLVPPGTYRLRFSYGTDWQNPETLFGDGIETGVIDLQDPLIFQALGPGIKAGHLVDLTGLQDSPAPDAPVKPQYICQAVRTELFPLPSADSPFDDPPDPGRDSLERLYGFPMFRHDVRSRYCR